MKKLLLLTLLSCGLGLCGGHIAFPQTPMGYAGGPVTTMAFYKIEKGQQDEWLALYKKYHNPLLRYEMKQGLLVSKKMFKRQVHELSPSWDFCVILVYRNLDAEVTAQKERQQVLHTVFPDIADFKQGDKKRWDLIAEHWDERLTQIPLE